MKTKDITTITITLFLATMLSITSVEALPWWQPPGSWEAGYNYRARIFRGLLGNYDENRYTLDDVDNYGDGDPDKFFGVGETDEWTFVANDGQTHVVFFDVAGTTLVMKWSTAWHMHIFGPDNKRPGEPGDTNDHLSWADAVAQYGEAWCTNNDVGSGEIDGATYEKMEGYSRIVWVGDTTGYTNPIWGECAIVQKVVSAPGVCLVFHEPLYSG